MNNFCVECGGGLPPKAKFCPNCGQEVTVVADKPTAVAEEKPVPSSAPVVQSSHYGILVAVAVIGLLVGAGFYYKGFVLTLSDKDPHTTEVQDGHNHPPVDNQAAQVQVSAEDIEKAKSMLASNPEDAVANTQVGNLLFDSGSFEEAITYYKKSLTIEPNSPDVIVDLGVCYFNLNNFPDAQKQFELALTQSPEHINALYNLGIVSLQMRDLEKLKSAWGRLMQVAPQSAQAQQAMQYLESIHDQVSDYSESPGNG